MMHAVLKKHSRTASALMLTLFGVLVTQRSSRDAAAAQAERGAPAGVADTLRFVEHPDTYPIGWPSNATRLVLTNPFERNAKALATGAQLYVAYNCIDCHGAEGSGSIGPSLADGRWHYGGRADEVFESIYQGRPDGMPAWGGRIATDQIWMLVTYVRSLNAGRDLSTENFTGRTVERTGH
jgi:cytochrome c oxidase cbb3-type subunit III